MKAGDVNVADVELSEREQIRQRVKATTPGDWGAYLGSGGNQCTAIGAEQPDGTIMFIADCLPDWMLSLELPSCVPKDHIPNLKFIESSRKDVLALLKECNKLDAVFVGLQALKDFVRMQDRYGQFHADVESAIERIQKVIIA